jgi:autophagy-related protein 9
MAQSDEEQSILDPQEFFNSGSFPSSFNNPTITVPYDEDEDGGSERQTPFTIVGNDELFKHLYEFQQGNGFRCILITQTCYVLTVLSTILFSTFLISCVDWTGLDDGTHQDLTSSIYPMCRPPEGRNSFFMFIFFVFLFWWFIMTFRTVNHMMRMWKIRQIWTERLRLSNDVKWVTWQQVIDRYHERIDQGADSFFLVNSIMRWDNYLIAMLTKDVFSMDSWGSSLFTKVFEWNLQTCINSALFRDNGMLINDVRRRDMKMEYTMKLRKTFMIYGVLNLILAPFVVSALSLFFIYRYFSEYHRNPKAMGLYDFTPIAKWKLRDFNELPHVYNARLKRAHPKIAEYLSLFTNEEVNIIFKFISFVMGSMLLILVIVSFFNQDIIVSLFKTEKPIIFYVGVLGALLVVLQTSTSEETLADDPDEKFDELVQMLHCMPGAWATMSQAQRYTEIRKVFRYRWLIFLQEIASVVYVPFIMIFWMPLQCANIVDFFRENTVKVKKLGLICLAAKFDSNQLIRAIQESEEDDVHNISLASSIERKWSTSVSNFRETYKTWDPVRFKREYVSPEQFEKEYEDKMRSRRRLLQNARNAPRRVNGFRVQVHQNADDVGEQETSEDTVDSYQTAGSTPRDNNRHYGSFHSQSGVADMNLPFPMTLHDEEL